MFDWDDLRILLAVAREGSTLAAARALGVNQSTVQRRLSALERCVGQPLAQRSPAGYRLTDFGRAWLPFAEHVEQAVLSAQQHVRDARRNLRGEVRVTCPQPLVWLLSRSALLERFRERHPGLRVEFVMSDRYLDLHRGEADIALRSGDTDDGELIGRKVGDSLWAVYASREYAQRRGMPARAAELAAHDIVAFDESMAGHRASLWLATVAPGARIVARNDSVLGLLYAVKSGVGVAALPQAVGDRHEDLLRVFGPVPELSRDWRLLTTPALRKVPRVAALFDYLVEEVDTLGPILSG